MFGYSLQLIKLLAAMLIVCYRKVPILPDNSSNPYTPSVPSGARLTNFRFHFKRDNKRKILYERRAYESVDERDEFVTYGQNFNFKHEGITKEISFERRDYESVDEKSLS